MSKEVADHVRSIAADLSAGTDAEWAREHLAETGEEASAFDYLESALDIEYVIGSDGEYRGGRVLVAFGGPNIWVDTQNGTVDGYWWGDTAHETFEDALGLDDALRELWGSR
jgi:hypothetical protein